MRNKELTLEDLSERTHQIVTTYLQNPAKTHDQLAKMLGITRGRVSQVLSSPRVTALYPILARRTIRQRLLPMAVKRYQDIISKSPNDAVAEKAAGRVMVSEGVLGSENGSVVVNVKTEITSCDVHKLREIVEKALAMPENVVEAEVVDDQVV